MIDDERDRAWAAAHDALTGVPGWAVGPCQLHGETATWHVVAVDLRPRGRQAKREAIEATGPTEVAALDDLAELLAPRRISGGYAAATTIDAAPGSVPGAPLSPEDGTRGGRPEAVRLSPTPPRTSICPPSPTTTARRPGRPPGAVRLFCNGVGRLGPCPLVALARR